VGEAAFSRALVKFWRERGYFVQRVETGGVGRGVPDIFVATKRSDLWVELKSTITSPSDGMVIPWRPGQQAWMYDYFRHTGRCCLTIAQCAGAYLVVPMNKLYPRNKITLADAQVYHAIKEILL
jgi:hypothetical protein